jgi:hypothetical protein
MTMHLLAIYAGPDQIMGVTSGIAGALGVLLLFWNKVVGTWFRLVGKLRPGKQTVSDDSARRPSAGNS